MSLEATSDVFVPLHICYVAVNVLNTVVSLLKLGLLSKDDSLILTLWPKSLVIIFFS